jgi:hypothetical protein
MFEDSYVSKLYRQNTFQNLYRWVLWSRNIPLKHNGMKVDH